MNKATALRTYKRINKSIVKEYEDADKYVWYNQNDPDLFPIRTELPECPDWNTIDNFGLPKEKQVFKREEMPGILKYLIDEIKLKIKRDKNLNTRQKKEDAFYDIIWNELESSLRYKKAVEWIESQWYHRLHGKWVFINGKPTYIAKNHWFYMNYWHIEGVGLPDYRDRDREWFWAMEYFKKDTTAPVYDIIDKNGKEEKVYYYNDDGSLMMKDVGYRTVDGVIVAKGRRAGDTTKSTCDIFCDTVLMPDANCGIQGDKEDTGEQVFHEKLMYAYKKLPFFWKPKTNYNTNSELLFESNDEESLNVAIDYKSANPTAYDGRKLYRYYADEPGKIEKYSVHERHGIVRLCLRVGAILRGFSIYTTTVNDMSSDSGKNFEKLCKDSFYEKRGDNGLTNSGMVFIHFKAYHGHEGFIGKYGESVIEKPSQEQLKYIEKRTNKYGEYIGAKDDILLKREFYRELGQYDEVSQQKRLHPLSFAESFSPPAQNIFFNTDILETRITELKRDKTATIRGDFAGDPHHHVRFVPNNDGRFIVSKLPPDNLTNRKYQKGGIWYPVDSTSYVSSSDAFRLNKTQGAMSNGGGAVKEIFNPQVDNENVPIEDHTTGLIVCTYNFRPETVKEFCMDMLRMNVFYGGLHYPEMNVNHVADFFNEYGFGGYLLFDTDSESGKPKANPGFHSGGDMKMKLFNKTRDYISMCGMRDKHLEYLQECIDIRGLDDMTHYDLFTACGGCHLGEQSQYGVYLKEEPPIDIKDALGW